VGKFAALLAQRLEFCRLVGDLPVDFAKAILDAREFG